MTDLYEKAAENFLELASHQRLQILFHLLEKKFYCFRQLSVLFLPLDRTVPA
jgi:hypothetical protein